MLRFVYDSIKLYNVRERNVHLTEASSIGFVQNVSVFCERFEVIMYNTIRCLGALRRLVVTTLYAMISKPIFLIPIPLPPAAGKFLIF